MISSVLKNNYHLFLKPSLLVALLVSCNQNITGPVESYLKTPLLVYEYWDYYRETDDYTQGNFIMLMMNDGEIQRISDSTSYSFNPKISPSGKEIMYSGNGVLIKYNIETNIKDTIRLKVSYYLWHPDGNKIIYYSGDKFGLHIYDFDTKESELLYFTYSYCRPIEFSPDSKTFLCDMEGLHYLISVDGSEVRKLVNPEVQCSYYRFTGDGKNLLCLGRGPNGKDIILKYQIAENKYVPITSDFRLSEIPCFSPDGNRICFAARSENNAFSLVRLYILDLESHEFKIIYKGCYLNLYWDNKTNYIYFISDRTICRIKPDGSGFQHLIAPSIDFIPYFELF